MSKSTWVVVWLLVGACGDPASNSPADVAITLPHDGHYFVDTFRGKVLRFDPRGRAFVIAVSTTDTGAPHVRLVAPDGTEAMASSPETSGQFRPLVILGQAVAQGTYRLELSGLGDFSVGIWSAAESFVPVSIDAFPDGPEAAAAFSLRLSRPVDLAASHLDVVDIVDRPVDGTWEARHDGVELVFTPAQLMAPALIRVVMGPTTLVAVDGARPPTELRLAPMPAIDPHPGGVRVASGRLVDMASDGGRVVVLSTVERTSCSGAICSAIPAPLELQVVERSGALLLAPVQLSPPFLDARVELNASGDGAIVWTDMTSGGGFLSRPIARRLWVQRLAGALPSGPPEMLCDLTTGGPLSYMDPDVGRVSLAVDDAGDVAVAYLVSRPSLPSEWTVRVFRAGTGWQPSLDEQGEVLFTETTFSPGPAVSMAAGRVLFVWSTASTVLARVYDQGAPEEARWPLPDGERASKLAAAINEDGHALVVYRGRDYHVQRRDGMGGGWREPSTFPDDPDNIRYPTECNLAVVLARRGDRGWLMSSTARGYAKPSSVWVQRLDSDGVGPRPMNQPVPYIQERERCALFIDTAGTVSAFWGKPGRTRRTSRDGSSFSPRAESFGTSYEEQLERVSGDGTVIVAWNSGSSGVFLHVE